MNPDVTLMIAAHNNLSVAVKRLFDTGVLTTSLELLETALLGFDRAGFFFDQNRGDFGLRWSELWADMLNDYLEADAIIRFTSR